MDVVGCEPRVDYSSCSEAHRAACPVFYAVNLAVQALILLASSAALLAAALERYRRKIAPHQRPRFWVTLRNAGSGLGKDTVMQLKLGCWAFSLAAVVHRGSLLQPTPALPHLVVEYCYSLYNIFLIATVATTLRYWQEFMFNAAGVSGVPPPALKLVDRLLLHVFSWKGCWAFVVVTSSVCLGTDTWGILSRDVENWHIAVKFQHYYLSGVCFLISAGSMRTGSFQERYITSLIKANSKILEGDDAFLWNLNVYKWLFRFSFVGNSLLWVICFMACGIGGVLFNEFYELVLSLLLAGFFNFAGLFFAAICGVLNLPQVREAELRLHDLLAYCNLAKLSRSQSLFDSEAGGKKEKKESPPLRSNWAGRGHLEAARAIAASLHGRPASTSTYCMYSGRLGDEDLVLDLDRGDSSPLAYPCYVMSLEDISRYDRLPTHEEALRDGTLRVVTKSSYWPCRSYVHFISQTWIDRSHPDGTPEKGSPKLQWMKRMAPKYLAHGRSPGDVFLWMDIFSIPQATPEFMKMGIASLPTYASLVGGFLPLVQDPDAISKYQRRGWCMVECICALTPKKNKSGEWRVGPHPRALQFQFYGDNLDHDHMRLVTLKTLKNPGDPRETDFTVEEDREVVEPIYSMCAKIMCTYALTGATSWDHTYNIDDRPGWLKFKGGNQDSI